MVNEYLREYYLSGRAAGKRPIDILQSYRDRGMSVRGLASMVIGIIAFTVVDTLVTSLITNEDAVHYVLSELELRENTLWVQSRTAEIPYELPYYQALRIIRKQGWKFVKVAPIRHIGRWEALRILFKGDNNGS